MNMIATNPQKAQLTVDKTALIQVLKKSFAAKENVFKELAQNGRRAGATEIRITINKSRKFISVSDNGTGIENFNTLLAVAKSGWDEATKATECPYGIGFLSALYTSDEIAVISRNNVLKANTDDILGFSEIDINTYEKAQGRTIVILRGGDIDKVWNADFERMFSGFPIDVYVNDVKLKRAHALDSGKRFLTSDHGDFYLHHSLEKDYHSDVNNISYTKRALVYYQGFLVHKTEKYDIFDYKWNIVHCNLNAYDAIAPDRHKLVDEEAAVKSIEAELFRLTQVDLLEKSKTMNPSEFVNSVKTLDNYEMIHLLNDIPIIPRCLISGYDDLPIISSNEDANQNHETIHPKMDFSRKEIETGEISLFEHCEDNTDRDDSTFERLMYQYLTESLSLDASMLDSDHWIHQHLKNLDVTVEIKGDKKPLTSEKHNGLYNAMTIFCDSYVLTGALGPVESTKQAFKYIPKNDHEYLGQNLFVVPINSVSPEYALLQCNAYDLEYHYDEDGQDEAEQTYRQWYDNERMAHQPDILLYKLLEDFGTKYPSLKGRNFQLNFNDEGELEVHKL